MKGPAVWEGRTETAGFIPSLPVKTLQTLSVLLSCLHVFHNTYAQIQSFILPVLILSIFNLRLNLFGYLDYLILIG